MPNSDKSSTRSRNTVVPMNDLASSVDSHTPMVHQPLKRKVTGHMPMRGSMSQMSVSMSNCPLEMEDGGEAPAAWGCEETMRDNELEVNFSWNVFFKEWCYNAVGTLLLPVMLLVEGYHGTKNRDFIGFKRGCFSQTTLFFVIYAIVVLWFMSPDIHESMSPFEVINTILHTTFAAFVIGVKYAYLPAKEYEEMSVPEPTIPQSDRQGRRQLLTGWIRLSPATISIEMARAAHRMRIAVNKLYLEERGESSEHTLATHFRKAVVTGVTDDTATKHAESESVGVNIKQVVGEIILGSVRSFSIVPFAMLNTAFALGVALIPSIVRVSNGVPFFGYTTASAILITLTILAQTLYIVRNEMFLLTAIVDLNRRRVFMRTLNDLITTGFVSRSLEGYVDPLATTPSDEEAAVPATEEHDTVINETTKPYIADLSIPRNVTTWLESRRLLLDFGQRYYDRIQAFVFYVAAILGLFSVYLVLTFFFPSIQIDDTGLLLIVLQAFIFTAVVFVCIIIGGSINSYGDLHVHSLLRAGMELRCRIHDEHVNGGEVTSMEDAERLIEMTVKAVENQGRLKPVRFLGVTASSGAARAALTIGLSGILSGLRVIAGV